MYCERPERINCSKKRKKITSRDHAIFMFAGKKITVLTKVILIKGILDSYLSGGIKKLCSVKPSRKSDQNDLDLKFTTYCVTFNKNYSLLKIRGT